MSIENVVVTLEAALAQAKELDVANDPIDCILGTVEMLADSDWVNSGDSYVENNHVFQKQTALLPILQQPNATGAACEGRLVERIKDLGPYIDPIQDKPILATAKNRRTGQTYGPNQTGDRRFIQWANEEAKDDDVIEVSEGALYNGTTSGRNMYLESNVLAIDKSLTFTKMVPEQDRYTLAPASVPYIQGHSGIVIYEPKQCRNAAGVLGSRKTILIEGFDFNNWGINGDDFGVKIRRNGDATNMEGFHTLVTLQDFKLGKLPNFRSASGISGSAAELIFRDGHVYDCGAGVNAGQGQDHGFYTGAWKVLFERIRSERTRKTGDQLMDGHNVKVSGADVVFNDCDIFSGEGADNSALIQMYNPGNLTVLNSRLTQLGKPSNGKGMIWLADELSQSLYDKANGVSLRLEGNAFYTLFAQAIVWFDTRIAAEIFDSVIVKGNSGRVFSLPPEKWFTNSPVATFDWRAENTVLDFVTGEVVSNPTPTPTPDPDPVDPDPVDPDPTDPGPVDPPVDPAPIALPAWRKRMTEVGVLYHAGEPASNVVEHGVWPKNIQPHSLQGGSSSSGGMGGIPTAFKLHHGYGGSVWAPDRKSHIFGGTGEGVFNNQHIEFHYGVDEPFWDVLTQPFFCTTLEEALACGASCYYNPSEAALLPPPRNNLLETTPDWNAEWLGDFPVAYMGWIFHRKLPGILTQGNNIPHCFRYNMPTYMPKDVTGDVSWLITNSSSFHGPFQVGKTKPNFVPANRWWEPEMLRSDGLGQKTFIHVMNMETKEWKMVKQELPYIHPFNVSVMHPYGFASWSNKRVYYNTLQGEHYFYVDFAGLTWENVENAVVSPMMPFPRASGIGMSTGGNSVMCNGHPTGRRLSFMQNAWTNSIRMIDWDNFKQYGLFNLPGYTPGTLGCGFGYDPRKNRLIVTTREAGRSQSFWSQLPDTPEVAANWGFTGKTLALAEGVAYEVNPHMGYWQYGQRSQYDPDYGVVFQSQLDAPMLAYRPYEQ